MRCLIDANIILDVISDREPFVTDSSVIWKMCETGQIEGYISALTFADLVYVLRKEMDPEEIETLYEFLRLIFYVAELNEDILSKASAMRWPDYEDAIQSATASRIRADYIISRNVKDYKDSKIVALTPGEMIGLSLR